MKVTFEGKGAIVNCRVGSLEMLRVWSIAVVNVNCRVGSLEIEWYYT